MMSYAPVMLLFILVLASLVAGEDNPLLELASREEVVQMAGYGEEKLSTVLITGSVHCEASHQPHAWPIQGASVGVNCQSHGSKWRGKSAVAGGVTDEFGEFMIDLPSHLHAIPNLEKVCTVKIHRIPKASLCRPAHVKKQKGLRLSSFGNGIRTYNAGSIRIKNGGNQ
ncbi:uncharacterized protein LOC109811411 [Cajanus cajan]|uniref:uncharacterized protein LOC109811411 n=1 Tax=Cajanus cajan TaxID=3821 RepID=UPI00098DCE6C|nr:uncharacterized protein LOC109811411 [Cajanus cajan]